MLIKDIRQIPKRPFPGIIKIAIITLVLLITFFPGQFAYFPFDYSSAFRDIQELSSDKYQGRRSGTSGRDLAADFPVEKLKEAGVKPGGNNGYINEFEISDNRMIAAQNIQLSFDGKDYTELYPGKDYRVVNFQPVSYDGEVEIVSGSETSVKHSDNAVKKPVRVFIPENIDERNYADMLFSLADGQAAVLTISGESFNGISMESEPRFNRMPVPVIELAQKWKDELKNNGKLYARINISVTKSESSKGKNIIGIIPGTDNSLKDEFVIVGASYDGIGWQNAVKYPGTFEGASSTAMSLEAAKAIMLKGPPKRTMVFMFWDYSERFECGAFEAGRFNGFNDKKGNLYIDLKYLGSGRRILFDSSRNSSEMPKAQRFSRILANEYGRLGMKVDMGGAQSYEADAMRQRGMGSVVIESDGSKEFVRSAKDNTEQLSTEDIKYTGQALINALIKMIY
jgi:hypothetical protein